LALLRSKDNKNEVAKKPPLKFVKLLLAKQKKGGSKFCSMKNGESKFYSMLQCCINMFFVVKLIWGNMHFFHLL
jgi:hypothetical protein